MTKQFAPGAFSVIGYVERLALNDIRPLQRWTQASLGSLLQLELEKGSPPAVFMRAEYDNQNGGEDGLLCLSGDDAGVFITTAFVMRSFALDVSKVARLVAIDPAPFELTATGGAPIGSLVYNWVEAESYFIRAKIFIPEGSDSAGFVCVESKNPKHKVGKFYTNLAGSDRMGISAKVGVEQLTKP